MHPFDSGVAGKRKGSEITMSRQNHDRSYGISLGRLPNYSAKSEDSLCRTAQAEEFRTSVLKFVSHKAATRVNGQPASMETIDKSKEMLSEVARRIWRLGFKLTDLKGLNGKHIEAVVRDYWACGASPKHMAALMTELNKLDDWLAKPGLVKKKQAYLPEVDPKEFSVSMVAEKSKSWTENGVDLAVKMTQADKKDRRFGLMLRMCLALGLRRCEVLRIVPHRDDKVTHFDIPKGIAKGGRARTIAYLSPAQTEIVQYVKSQVKKNEHLGWMEYDWTDTKVKIGKNGKSTLFERNEKRYSYLMGIIGMTKSDSGVTGHGLRAEYAEDMSMLMGLLPATRGGTKGQMPQEDEDAVRMQVSLNMGHSRTKVTNAYYGKLTKKIQNSRGERLGGFALSDGKFASIYMNPPPKLGAEGKYTRLQKRTIEATDFSIVLETATEDGLLSEAGGYKVALVKNPEHAQMVGLLGKKDLSDLNRIGATLLAKFGVVLGAELV
jgi:integrase